MRISGNVHEATRVSVAKAGEGGVVGHSWGHALHTAGSTVPGDHTVWPGNVVPMAYKGQCCGIVF